MPDEQGLRRADAPGGRRLLTWSVAAVVFVLLLAGRFAALDQRPVWDGAMSLAPAAIALERLDFDFQDLLELPGYEEGGPNVHSLSLMTLFTAGSIRIFGSYTAALPFLHLTSFALAAALAAGVFRMLFPITGSRTAAASAVVTLLYPPMLVQASDVYLDLPVAAAAVWALVFLVEDRWAVAVAFTLLAAMIKPTGVILIAVLALALLGDGRRLSFKRLASVAIPAVAGAAPLLLNRSPSTISTGGLRQAGFTFDLTIAYLQRTPTFILLSAIGLVSAVACLVVVRVRREILERATSLVIAAGVTILVAFAMFFLLNPLVSRGFIGLPRYTTLPAPLLVASSAAAIHRLVPHRSMVAIGLIGLLFAIDLGGAIDPSAHNLYPLSERSLAYESHLAVQTAALARFEELAQEIPVYYDHHTHYRFAYPEEGWVSSQPMEGTPVHITDDLITNDLSGYPPRFAVMIEASWLGGEGLQEIVDTARSDDRWDVHVEAFTSGPYEIEVIVVERSSS